MKRLRTISYLTVLSALVFATGLAPAARSQESADNDAASTDAPVVPDANIRVARLSFFYGGAQIETLSQGWQDAQINLPLQEGFKLRTADGRAEVQFDDGSLLRLAQNTTIELPQLALVNGNPATKINVASGTVLVEGKLNPSDAMLILTPNLSVEVTNGAKVRVDVTDGNSWVTVIAGDLQVTSPSGVTPLGEGNLLHLGPDGQVEVEQSPSADDFDTWSSDRDHLLLTGESSSEPYIQAMQNDTFYSAYADLSQFGYWGTYPGYGICWIPYGVPVNWMPFGIGSWRFFHRLGWTWISAEPWGWLPYHFGSWFHTPHGWAWSPNPVRFFNPGAVDWIQVNGRTGWVPAGTFGASRRPAGAAGFVLGTEAVNGVIRSERGTGAGPISTMPDPVIVASHPPMHPKFESRQALRDDHSIVFDPATRTYVNSNPRPVQGETSAPRNAETRGFVSGENSSHTANASNGNSNGQRPITMRPQFGPPAGYSTAAPPNTLNSPRPQGGDQRERPVRPEVQVPHNTQPAGAPAGGPHFSSAPTPAPSAPHSAPAPAPAPHASSPPPAAHASSGSPHH